MVAAQMASHGASAVEAAVAILQQRPLDAAALCGSAPSTPPRKRQLDRNLSDEKSTSKCMRLADEAPLSAKKVDDDVVPALPETPEQPYPLVAREIECKTLDRFLERSLSAGADSAQGGCIYVSGGPGTGKTCSVRAAVGAWQRGNPASVVVQVNCMQLAQRSPTGLLRRLGELALARSGSRAASSAALPSSGAPLAAAVAARLSVLGPSVIVIADEIDQVLSNRAGQGSCNGLDPLGSMLSVTQCPGSAAIAFIAIANAVDLLERSGRAPTRAKCEALLFQPYSAAQLKSILQSKFAAQGALGVAAAKALGPVQMELGVRKVAKSSGDCRQVMNLCEQAFFEAAAIEERSVQNPSGDEALATPQKPMRPKSTLNDPLAQVKQLALDQQILLCALAGSKGEAMKFSDIFARYKELCKKLHRTMDLASKDQVSSALSALEQRGLLSLRIAKRAAVPRGAAGRGRAAAAIRPIVGATDSIAELAVSCKAVKESVTQANPLLGQCID